MDMKKFSNTILLLFWPVWFVIGAVLLVAQWL